LLYRSPAWAGFFKMFLMVAALHVAADRGAMPSRLVDEDGKPIIMPHGLRATGATLAASNGVNPIIIQHQLGHASQRDAGKLPRRTV